MKRSGGLLNKYSCVYQAWRSWEPKRGGQVSNYVFNGAVEFAIDSVIQKENRVSGDTYNLSGSFIGSNVNINSTLSAVTQTIGALPSGDPIVKQELTNHVKHWILR